LQVLALTRLRNERASDFELAKGDELLALAHAAFGAVRNAAAALLHWQKVLNDKKC
jgi:hypothetical protein